MIARFRIVTVLALIAVVHASPAAAAPEVETTHARTSFKRGTDLVRASQWGEALAAFEESLAVREHAVTRFNIGACERALGRYTRARVAFEQTLERGKAHPDELSSDLASDARAFLDQIGTLLATVDLKLDPADVAVAVDGRPLERQGGEGTTFIAGLRPAGRGEAPGVDRLRVLLDPGVHVFTFSKQGFTDGIVNKSFSQGTTTVLDLHLDRLPATVVVSSSERDAIVHVDAREAGLVPVEIMRPPGRYKIAVSKSGFDGYESEVTVRAGERIDVRATLNPESRPITSRWWFWAGAAGVVAAVVVITYVATREDPEPTRPAVNGGGLGWPVRLP